MKKTENLLKREDNILYFDIETLPCFACVWTTGKQIVTSDNIFKERKIATISYMWEGEKKPTTLVFDLQKHNLLKYDDDADKKILKQFSDVVQQANMIVAHNGKRFDIPILKARLIKHGLPDIRPTLIDDSYLLSRGIGFVSHKLNHIARFLNNEQKLEVHYDLWLKIALNKDANALKLMAKYNEKDVLVLANVYRRLRSYINSSMNLTITRGVSLDDNPSSMCPSCGSSSQKRGLRHTRTGSYQAYSCRNRNCGKWFQSGTNLLVRSKQYPR